MMKTLATDRDLVISWLLAQAGVAQPAPQPSQAPAAAPQPATAG